MVDLESSKASLSVYPAYSPSERGCNPRCIGGKEHSSAGMCFPLRSKRTADMEEVEVVLPVRLADRIPSNDGSNAGAPGKISTGYP